MKFMNNSYVKIYRFDDAGFYCKPYTSKAFHHVFEFINVEVTDLFSVNQSIPKARLHKPEFNDYNWSGCFCFLDNFNKDLVSVTGALSMRSKEQLNLALLPGDTKVWVRNCSHFGKEMPFFKEFTYSYTHEEKEYHYWDESRYDCYRWVRLSADLALERTRLWKESNIGESLPEWLTEFYLMESQLKLFLPPPLSTRTRLYIRNLLRKR